MWVLLYLIPLSTIALALAQWWRTNLFYGGIKYKAIKPWSKNRLRSGYFWYGLTALLSSPFALAYDLGPPLIVELNFLCSIFILLFVLLPPTFLCLGVSSGETDHLRLVLLKARPLLKSLTALNPWLVRHQDWDNIRSDEEHAWFPHIIELTSICPIIVLDIRVSSTALRRELAFVLKPPHAQKTIFLGHSSDPYINYLLERVERRRRAYNEAELIRLIAMITNSKDDLLSFYQVPLYKPNSQLSEKPRLPVTKSEEHYWAELLCAIHLEMTEIFSAKIPSPCRIELVTTQGEKIYRYESADLALVTQTTSTAETKVQEVLDAFEGKGEDIETTAKARLDALSVETILESIDFWRMKRLEQIRELCPICGELYTLKAGFCLNNIRYRVELLMGKRDPGTAQILLKLLDEVVAVARIVPAVKDASERYSNYSIRCYSHSEFEPDLELEREISHAKSHLTQPALQANMLVNTLQQTLNAIGQS